MAAGRAAEAEALRRDAEEAGVEVGVERPLGAAIRAGDAPARLVGVTAVTDGTAWPRRLAGVLDVCAERAGSREAARLWAEAERDGARLLAVAVSVRFRNGALAQALVRAAAPGEAVAGVRALSRTRARPQRPRTCGHARSRGRRVRPGRRRRAARTATRWTTHWQRCGCADRLAAAPALTARVLTGPDSRVSADPRAPARIPTPYPVPRTPYPVPR